MGITRMFTDDIYNQFKKNKICQDKKLYFIDYSEHYYVHLAKQIPDIINDICGVLTDISYRMAGSISKDISSIIVGSRKIPIYPYNFISELDENDYFVILNDYYDEIFLKLQNLDEINKQNHLNIYFFPNQETEIQLRYQKKLQNYPLENIMVFKSGPHMTQYVSGMDFADNARALFEYLVSEGFDKKWRIVWLVHNPKEYQDMYPEHPNIEFISEFWAVSDIKKEREHYYRILFLAKLLFFTDAYGFTRNCRKDQVRVQLWHGCGYKTRINFSRCEHRYEYNIVISKVYKEIHKRIYGLRDDQVLITGYPKEDWLFKPLNNWKELFGIPEGKKYIFWLPTFRNSNTVLGELNEKGFDGEIGLPIIKTTEQMQKINELLKELNVVLVLKLHPFQDRSKIKIPNNSNICVIENEELVDYHIPINRVLGNADALISDYSSAAVDYLILDRPIAYILEDMEEYKNSRGFVFDNIQDWLPGKEIWTFDDFTDFICDIGHGKDPDREKRRTIRDKTHDFYDDRSSSRVMEVLLKKLIIS